MSSFIVLIIFIVVIVCMVILVRTSVWLMDILKQHPTTKTTNNPWKTKTNNRLTVGYMSVQRVVTLSVCHPLLLVKLLPSYFYCCSHCHCHDWHLHYQCCCCSCCPLSFDHMRCARLHGNTNWRKIHICIEAKGYAGADQQPRLQ